MFDVLVLHGEAEKDVYTNIVSIRECGEGIRLTDVYLKTKIIPQFVRIIIKEHENIGN